MNQNIIRQVKDIQLQADNLLNSSLMFEDIDSFHKYSEEIKSQILTHHTSETILNLISDIPNFEFKDAARSSKSVEIFDFDLVGIYKNNCDLLSVKDWIKITQSKFASIELLINNDFD